MERLAITVLTGFLGAGKTTLLKRLLALPHGRRIGVIINEIGTAGTEDLATRQQAYLELAEGCVCCTSNPELIAAVEALWRRQDLDLVIIETTGVADPLALTFTLERPDVAEMARLDAVVTVVDAASFDRVTDAPEWRSQVGAADVIVLAKLDVAGAAAGARARAALAAVNPVARVLAGDDEGAAAVLLDAVHEAHGPARAPAHAHPVHSGFKALSVATPERYDVDRLEDLLEALPPSVFRAKGIVHDAGADRWIAFHVVAGRLDLVPDVRPPAHGESRMVFLGRGIDEPGLLAEIAAARG